MRSMRRMPLLVAGVVTTVMLTALPASAITTGTYEKQVLTRTNVERVKHDRVKVKAMDCIDRYAEKQARWMLKHHKLQHQDLGPILTACKLTGVAENIAYGYSSGTSVVQAWMKSPGHKSNLLNSKMRYLGVGAVQGDDGTWWVAQVFGTRK